MSTEQGNGRGSTRVSALLPRGGHPFRFRRGTIHRAAFVIARPAFAPTQSLPQKTAWFSPLGPSPCQSSTPHIKTRANRIFSWRGLLVEGPM
jgi:hypothetical protein